MSSLSTLDLQNNDIAQVPPQLGNVTQLRWEGGWKLFQLVLTLWSLFSIFLSPDIAVSETRNSNLIFKYMTLCPVVPTSAKKSSQIVYYALKEKKTAITQGKKSKYRTVLSRKNPNAIQVILCPARLEPQYCNFIIKLQKDCFKISGSVTDIKEV